MSEPLSARRSLRPAPKDQGFTLVEVTIVSALIAVLTLMIVQSLADLAKTQAYTQGQSRIAEIADRAMRGVISDVTYSIRLFTDGDAGDEYLATMGYPAAKVAADSRLPLQTQRGYFEKDPEDELVTGNVLFLARNEQPVLVTVGSADTPYRIDTLSFVIYYLWTDKNGNLDLARWGSVPVARHKDITIIADPTERSQAITKLFEAGVRYAWDTTSEAAAGLFEVSQLGSLQPLVAGKKVPEDPAQARTSILSRRHVAIAPNGHVGKVHVPEYANPTAAGFPAGFEVMVDGPSTGKLVMIRMVLRSGLLNARPNFAESKRLVACRDG